eukprot:TRINITY_DN827_c4_g1_i1.p1 TRINITY_DN827_c4_g1~~TRINITY_DN827_c4_g1_i1.p1  ORF type:complete len:364 (+),score=83.46 TRINITY_DN827_c4_g1_i1:61-1092(+)
MSEEFEPTLQNIIQREKLQWVFVGGKGGVGKTTSSCSLATALAGIPKDGRQRKILIISTDPAHNLSDAFSQKFGRDPTPVEGVPGLEAMEIDPAGIKQLTQSLLSKFDKTDEQSSGIASALDAMKEAFLSLPGIDEVSVLVHIMNEIKKMKYDMTIFDTAPTGHTLRLLSLPQTLNTTIDKLQGVQGIGNMISQAGAVVTSSTGLTSEEIKDTGRKFTETIKEVQAQFQNNELTTFIPVCIAEFLPVYETERLIRDLCKFKIDVQNVIVNQIMMTPEGEAPHPLLESRKRIQKKYLDQIDELYEDFHVVRMPVLTNEVRGVEMLKTYGKYLLEPYNVNKVGYI